jgi:hypothetical protein
MVQKVNLTLGFVCLILLGSNVLADVTVVNNLGDSAGCPGGNTLNIFTSGGQQTIAVGASATVQGDFSSFPGLGIQVNNWYWTSVDLPVQTGPPQSPDNSGGQFTVDGSCNLNQEPAWYGEGIPTWLIATVSASQSGSGCTITVSPNAYTEAVTPGCCSPPGIGGNTCSGPYGQTNNGDSWPPS